MLYLAMEKTKKTSLLSAFFEGMAHSFDMFPDIEEMPVGSFKDDWENIRSDFRAIGGDMHKAMSQIETEFRYVKKRPASSQEQ